MTTVYFTHLLGTWSHLHVMLVIYSISVNVVILEFRNSKTDFVLLFRIFCFLTLLITFDNILKTIFNQISYSCKFGSLLLVIPHAYMFTFFDTLYYVIVVNTYCGLVLFLIVLSYLNFCRSFL